eukprot:754898-Hanusia_phi.AAC.6
MAVCCSEGDIDEFYKMRIEEKGRGSKKTSTTNELSGWGSLHRVPDEGGRGWETKGEGEGRGGGGGRGRRGGQQHRGSKGV